MMRDEQALLSAAETFVRTHRRAADPLALDRIVSAANLTVILVLLLIPWLIDRPTAPAETIAAVGLAAVGVVIAAPVVVWFRYNRRRARWTDPLLDTLAAAAPSARSAATVEPLLEVLARLAPDERHRPVLVDSLTRVLSGLTDGDAQTLGPGARQRLYEVIAAPGQPLDPELTIAALLVLASAHEATAVETAAALGRTHPDARLRAAADEYVRVCRVR